MAREHALDHDHGPGQHEYRLPYHWTGSAFLRYVVDVGVRRLAPILRGKRVLEMGCGDGYGTAQMARYADRIHGFDLNERAIAFARLLVDPPHVTFDVARADKVVEQAAALEGDVDVVASLEVIEHLPAAEREMFLEGARQVLASRGGYVLLSTPNGARGTRNPYHAHEFRPDELGELLTGVGFGDVAVQGLYLQPPWPRLEHFADTVPFRAGFRALARAGASRPTACRTLLVVATAR